MRNTVAILLCLIAGPTVAATDGAVFRACAKVVPEHRQLFLDAAKLAGDNKSVAHPLPRLICMSSSRGGADIYQIGGSGSPS